MYMYVSGCGITLSKYEDTIIIVIDCLWPTDVVGVCLCYLFVSIATVKRRNKGTTQRRRGQRKALRDHNTPSATDDFKHNAVSSARRSTDSLKMTSSDNVGNEVCCTPGLRRTNDERRLTTITDENNLD